MYTINLNGTQGVAPELDEVFRKVFLKRPSLRYVARSRQDKSGNAFVLDVYDNIEWVGEVMWKEHRPSRGEAKTMFHIRSPNIKKDRSPSDTLLTTKASSAIKTLLNTDTIKPRSVDEKIKEKLETAVSELDALMSRVRYRLEMRNNNLELLRFLFACKDGENPKIEDYPGIVKNLTPENEKALDDYAVFEELEGQIARGGFYCIEYEVDESLTAYSSKTNSVVYQGKSTYELPQWAQGKLTMLKMVENNQAIRGVGFRYEDIRTAVNKVVYVLIDGEIPNMVE
jgi:hypothetical protein